MVSFHPFLLSLVPRCSVRSNQWLSNISVQGRWPSVEIRHTRDMSSVRIDIDESCSFKVSTVEPARQQHCLDHSKGAVRAQSHAFRSFALRAVQCCVLFRFRRQGAHWMLRVVASCFGPCSCAFLCCCSALVGQLSVLNCAFGGFPLLHMSPNHYKETRLKMHKQSGTRARNQQRHTHTR